MRLQTCVECGTGAPRLIGGLCPACFVRRESLLRLPEVVDVEVCTHCDARHVGAHWVDPEEGAPLGDVREEAVRAAAAVHAEVLDARIEVAERPMDERTFAAEVRLSGQVEGVPVADSRTATVRMRRSVCDRCSRMFGGFYAAIIQLRATDRDVTEPEMARAHDLVGGELDRQRASGNREAFLTKSEPVPGGYDYLLGDIESARAVARLLGERLHASVTESAKLAGRKEGNDIHRVTFLVRIHLFATGDFAATDGERPVQVLSIDRGRALVVDLATRRRDKVDPGRLRRLGGREVLQQAVVVSQDASGLQVLDPVSLRTVDMPRPPGLQVAEPTLAVLRFQEQLFVPAWPAGSRAAAPPGPPDPDNDYIGRSPKDGPTGTGGN